MKRREFLFSLAAAAQAAGPAQAAAQQASPSLPGRDPKSPDPDLGSLFSWIEKQQAAHRHELSFLNPRFRDAAAWQREVRPQVFDRLFYRPAEAPPEAQVLERVETPEFIREKIEFSTTPDFRVPAYVHIPRQAKLPAPGFVVLHDHGGFYYFGKEKVTELPDEHAELQKFKQRYYGGRSIATELARAGFVTIAIDMFYWGERRLILEEDRRRGVNDWSQNEAPEMIRALNARASQYEQIVARTLFSAGLTWSGIWIWDDLRTLDYLASRPEVDARRLGCVGLSVGGLRSGHLAALDPRIRVAVVVGWMTAFGPCLRKHIWNTIGLTKIVPGLYRQMDYPDFVALAAPRPLLVIHGSRDALFPPEGVRQAVEKLTACYRKAGAADRFRFLEYDGPHEFNLAMQEQAFAWLKRWT